MRNLSVKSNFVLIFTLLFAGNYLFALNKAEWFTSKGSFTIELREDLVPKTAGNFSRLANTKFYDGLNFHRVIDGFMIQGGCPNGTGNGDPGYEFEDEFHPDLLHSKEGILSMANSGPNTNGSQFFITLAATAWLNGKHSVFGEVTEGMEVVREIGHVDTDSNDMPLEEVLIDSIRVSGIYDISVPYQDYILDHNTYIEIDMDSIFTCTVDSEIDYNIVENTNPDIIPAAFEGNTLIVASNNTLGSSEITIGATCGEYYTFHKIKVYSENMLVEYLIDESFENIIFPPQNWAEVQESGTMGKWVRNRGSRIPGGNSAIDGEYIAYFNSYSSSCDPGNNTRLELPILDLTEYKENILRFYFSHNNHYINYGNDSLQIQVKVGNDNWQNIGPAIKRWQGRTEHIWQEHIIDLSEYDQKSDIKLAFLGMSANGSDIVIDHIRVGGININSIDNPEITSKGYILHHNYPNPFNPETKINYEIKHNQKVNIVVFNALGEKVWETGLKNHTAGAYSINFNGSGLNSGVYYYSIELNGTIQQTNKMILIK